MTEIIVMTPEQLQATVQAAVARAFAAQQTKEDTPRNSEKDNLTITEASAFLGEQGRKISIQTLYTKTHKDEIPYRKIGGRLVFSKKALLAWIEDQTVLSISRTAEGALELARSAKNQG